MFPKKVQRFITNLQMFINFFSSHEKQINNEWHYMASARKPGLNFYHLELILVLISFNLANFQFKSFFVISTTVCIVL